MRRALEELSRLDVGRIQLDAPLREHAWWRIGGPADLLVEPGSVQQVQTLRRALGELELPHVIVGDGSNTLFDDEGVRGVVVKIGRSLSRVTIAGDLVTAEAGIFVPRLARRLGSAGLSGLEHTIGIPGTLGGLALMNGGSLRKGIGSHIERLWGVDVKGDMVEYDQSACRFSYRQSALQDDDVVVVRAQLRCTPGDPRTIRREMLEVMRSRRGKFPLKQPNCGSVFLSDPALYETVGPPGKIIEECGFKGLRIGDAMIPHRHANFIVNLGHARAADVLEIIREVRQTVQGRTGFMLKCEVRYVAPDGRLMPADEVFEKENL